MPTGSPRRFGRGVDRPVVTLAQRHVVHHQQQDLDKALVGRDAVDLFHRQFGVLHRHDDRGAQARLLVEPLARDPVVQGVGETGAHVLAEQQLRAVEAVADRQAGAEWGERLRSQRIEVRAGLAVEQAPVGARCQRRVGRICDRFQLVYAALHDDVAPVVGKVRQQRFQIGDRGMNVAVDAAWFDEGHVRVRLGIFAGRQDSGRRFGRPTAAQARRRQVGQVPCCRAR